MLDSIAAAFTVALNFLLNLLLYIPKKVFSWIVDGILWLYDQIPVPDFINNIPSLFGNITSGVWWFLEPLHIGTGLAILLAAYAIRFFIRRLPIIG